MLIKSNFRTYLTSALLFISFMFIYRLFEAPRYSLISYISFSVFYISTLHFFRRDRLHPALIISTIYFLSSVFSLFVDQNFLAKYGYSDHYDLHVLFIYIALLLTIMVPSFVLKKTNVDWSKRVSFLDFIVKWSWPFLLFSVIYLTPFAIRSLAIGAELVRSTVLYEDGVLPASPLTTLAVGVAQFFSLFIMLWFYAGIKNYSKYIRHSLLLGPLAGILWGFVFAARDVLIWVPLMFLLGYWFWYDYFDSKFKKKFMRLLMIVLTLSICSFSLFTFQRFSSSQEGVLGSIVGYFGYQPYVFAEIIKSHTNFYGLNLRFPFLAQIMGTYSDTIRDQPYEWQFATILADFYNVSGWVSLFSLSFIFSIFFFLVLKKNFLFNHESRLVVMILYFNIVTQGVFYFRLGSISGNEYIILMLILAFILNIRHNKT